MKKINITVIIFLFTLKAFSQASLLIMVKPSDTSTWGYSDQYGKMVIPAQYSTCFPFYDNGLATIFDETTRKYYFINAQGKKLNTVIPYVELDNNFGYGVRGFSNGFAPFVIEYRWGYLNKKGEIAIQPKYKIAMDFCQGYAIVKFRGKFLILDSLGNEHPIKTQVREVKNFTYGKAAFKGKNGLFGFINTNGDVIVEPKYRSVGYFVNNIAWFKTCEKKVGFLNEKGEEFIKAQFTRVSDFDDENTMARVQNGYDSYYIKPDGQIMRPVKDIIAFGDFYNGLAKAESVSGGGYGYINKAGEWAIKPHYYAVRDFKNGYAAVRAGKLWGLINTKGEIVTQPQFSAVKDMELIR